jgi:hypothetical protein
VSWWLIVLEVIALSVATVAWARQLRRLREKRARAIAAKDAATAIAVQTTPPVFGGPYYFDFGNVDPQRSLLFEAAARYSQATLYGTVGGAYQPSTAPIWAASAYGRSIGDRGLARRVVELESQLAELEQRVEAVEGQVVGLGRDSRNVMAPPARIRDIVSSVLKPIPAS